MRRGAVGPLACGGGRGDRRVKRRAARGEQRRKRQTRPGERGVEARPANGSVWPPRLRLRRRSRGRSFPPRALSFRPVGCARLLRCCTSAHDCQHCGRGVRWPLRACAAARWAIGHSPEAQRRRVQSSGRLLLVRCSLLPHHPELGYSRGRSCRAICSQHCCRCSPEHGARRPCEPREYCERAPRPASPGARLHRLLTAGLAPPHCIRRVRDRALRIAAAPGLRIQAWSRSSRRSRLRESGDELSRIQRSRVAGR